MSSHILKNAHVLNVMKSSHYINTSWISCNERLNRTAVKLELFSDVEMHVMDGSGMRGEISYVRHRYSWTNIVHINHFDKNQKSKYLRDFYLNNYHGWALPRYLLTNE